MRLNVRYQAGMEIQVLHVEPPRLNWVNARVVAVGSKYVTALLTDGRTVKRDEQGVRLRPGRQA